jgi:hypothetical protein
MFGVEERNTMSNTDPELQALAEADPAAGITLTPAEAHVYLAAALGAGAGARPSRWRKRVAAAVAVVVGVGVVVPGIAYAGRFLALTGDYVNPTTFEPVKDHNPENQVVEMTSPDYPELVASEWPAYVPLPEGYDQKVFATALGRHWQKAAMGSDMGKDAPGILETVALIHSELEFAGRCVWVQEWLDAAPGSRQRERATSVLLQAPGWPATVASDGGGVVDDERRVAEAARDGKESVVREDDSVSCMDYRHFPGTKR